MCKERDDYSLTLYLWINENLINKNACKNNFDSHFHVLYKRYKIML